MLRIPLPEVARATPMDTFALALPVVNQALKGRQITNGVSEAYPHPALCHTLPPTNTLAPSAQGLMSKTGGCALLAPVRNLSPLFSVALPRAHLQG